MNDKLCFAFSLHPVVFFLVYQLDSLEWANSYTCRFHAGFDSLYAAVALNHLAIMVETRSSERASHNAAVTADAVGVVVNSEVGVRILADASCRACLNTWCILAVHAADRHECHCSILAPALFYCNGLTERLVTVSRFYIILIHAGYDTGSAGNTFLSIKNKHFFHGNTSCLKPFQCGI